MKPNIKKLLILNAPYLLFVYLFDKVGQAVRLSPGADLSGKLLSIGSGFSAAFSNALTVFLCVLAFHIDRKPDNDSPDNADKQIHRGKTRQGI